MFEQSFRTWNGFLCSVRVKRENAVIHILDLNGEVSLTNAIDHIQRPILEQLGREPVSVDDFVWILYHTDGVISRFHSGSFYPDPENLVLDEFRDEMNRLYPW